jgi:hypothetical protein
MQDETWENGDWRLGNVMKSNNCVVCWETKNGLTRLLGEHFLHSTFGSYLKKINIFETAFDGDGILS